MKKILILLVLLIVIKCNAQQSHKDSLTEQIKLEAKPVYIKAFSLIEKLREDVALAKDNKLSKQEVVNYYNKTAGKVMRSVNSFKEVDKKLKDGGDAYVEFMFDKECARIAREHAAAIKFQQEQIK